MVSAVRETEACLERIERHGERVNAFITVTADSALEAARAADEAQERGEWLGLLHGVTATIKDSFHVAGVRTTLGSALYGAEPEAVDSEAVARMRAHGPVFLGKNNLAEFCYGATGENARFGRVCNPWGLDRITGGSSSGSAAAVAAGMSRISLGTDTGGSVRVPAALCGVTGLRPTVGRISGARALSASATFDTVGPLAYGVADVARAYVACAGYDPDDPISVEAPVGDVFATMNAGVTGMRIGLPRRFYFEQLEEKVGEAVMAVAAELERQGAQIMEIDLPDAHAIHEVVLFSLVTADMADLHREEMATHSDSIGAEVMRRLNLGLDITGRDYAGALRALAGWRASFRSVFEEVDAFLTPTTPMVAPRFDAARDMIETTRKIARFTYGIGATGLPSMSLPCGFGVGGMPVGCQIVSRWLNEAALFRIGHAFQKTTDFHRARPAL